MARRPTEVTYDPEADMAYVRVVEAEPGGFELFDASWSLPVKVLEEFR